MAEDDNVGGSAGGGATGPPPAAAAPGAGAGAGAGGSAQTQAPMAPQVPVPAVAMRPFTPKVEPPTFTELTLGAVADFLLDLRSYYIYLRRMGMAAEDAVDTMNALSIKEPTVRRWSLSTPFTGEWEDYEAKFKDRWVPASEARKAGRTLSYATWQNKDTIASYGARFARQLDCCRVAGYKTTPDTLAVAYARGLNPAYHDELARRGMDDATWEEAQEFLLRLENSGVFRHVSSQPRQSNNSSSGSGSSNNTNKPFRNNSNNTNNKNMSNGSNYSNKSGGSSNAGGGGGGPRGGGGNRNAAGADGGGGNSRANRDYSNYECLLCGEHGHIRRDCPNRVAAADGGKK